MTTTLADAVHADFRSSAYIIVSNVSARLNELDIARVFSQYGEIADIHIQRSNRGAAAQTAFICYEDQRSTDLAVDNFEGILLDSVQISVRHLRDYVPPRGRRGAPAERYRVSGPDGRGFGAERHLTEREERFVRLQEARLREREAPPLSAEREKANAARVKARVADANLTWKNVYDKTIGELNGGDQRALKASLEHVLERKRELLLKKAAKRN